MAEVLPPSKCWASPCHVLSQPVAFKRTLGIWIANLFHTVPPAILCTLWCCLLTPPLHHGCTLYHSWFIFFRSFLIGTNRWDRTNGRSGPPWTPRPTWWAGSTWSCRKRRSKGETAFSESQSFMAAVTKLFYQQRPSFWAPSSHYNAFTTNAFKRHVKMLFTLNEGSIIKICEMFPMWQKYIYINVYYKLIYILTYGVPSAVALCSPRVVARHFGNHR